MPKFLLKFNAAVIKEIPITKEVMTIGRKPENDIVIDNPAVSGHHCKVYIAGDTYFVEDLNSTNGVFVNEKKVLKSGLKDKDVIGIFKHTLVFLDDRNAPADPAPAAHTGDATVFVAAEKLEEMAAAAAAAAHRKPAVVRIVKGLVDVPEYELKSPSTYIGKSDRVQIKIKGTGFFNKAPENAAMIAMRPDGYYLVPIELKYVRLNGEILSEKKLLNRGDLIEAGGTSLQFFPEG